MPTSVRLDATTERLVERLAREEGQTKSEVIRAAIRAAAESRRRKRKGTSAYDRIAHLIGVVRGGPPDLSEDTGEKFRQLLEAKRRRRR
jgi:Arc/MetJ-type ribon-helix-helix transcriptional regulator